LRHRPALTAPRSTLYEKRSTLHAQRSTKGDGMLDIETLKQMVADERIETVLTVFPDMYGRLMGKRIAGHYFVNDVLEHAIHACDYLLACDMEMDPVPGYAFTSWQAGYGDFRLVPDLKTWRVASWLEKTALVLCDVYEEEKETLVEIAPRSILRQQIEIAARRGYVAMGGSELELYVFKDSYEEAARKKYMDLEPIGNYIEDYHIFRHERRFVIVLFATISTARACRWSFQKVNGGRASRKSICAMPIFWKCPTGM
jgi:glutamine synthetase